MATLQRANASVAMMEAKLEEAIKHKLPAVIVAKGLYMKVTASHRKPNPNKVLKCMRPWYNDICK